MKKFIDVQKIEAAISEEKSAENARKEAHLAMSKFKNLAVDIMSTIDGYQEAVKVASNYEAQAEKSARVRELITAGLSEATRALFDLRTKWAYAHNLLIEWQQEDLRPAFGSPADRLARLLLSGKRLHDFVERPKGKKTAVMKAAFGKAKKK